MKLDFESLIERFTKDLTPAKIVLGLAALVIVLAVISTLVNIATSLLPIAVLAVAAYFGYQWLNSRTDTMLSKRNQTADSSTNADAVTLAEDAVREEANRRQERAADNLRVDDSGTEPDVISGAVMSKGDSMKIPPRINPTTGLPEADISRLEQAEEQSAEITDSVLAQLAERRKRLLGEQDS